MLLYLVWALGAVACHRNRPQPLTETERRELVRQFQGVIASTGGSQVWVKPNLQRSKKAEPPFEVLATSSVYPALEAALGREAAQHKLDFAKIGGAGAGELKTADVEVSLRGQRVYRVHLREVERLLRATIVIDDLGQDLEAARKLLALSYPLTYSILPQLRYSSATAQDVHRAGGEVMLHLPMDARPGSHPDPGEGALHTGMREAEARQVIENDLATVPFAAGVNNHMGSRATQSGPLMTEVMKILAADRLYFIDSRTSAESLALDTARREGVPSFYRAVFLDDQQTVAYTVGQLRELCRVVHEQGAALAIGHPHPTTLAALARFLPEFERADIELVPASRLVRLPEIARLHPPGARR